MLRALLTAAALVLALPGAAVAGDGMDDYDEAPTMHWPIIQNPPVVRVQIEGPRNLWGMRQVAKRIDAQVDGLRIYRAGTCADRPSAECVRVVVKRHGKVGWWGSSEPWYSPRVIDLNASYGYSRNTACHELLHALGLGHHHRNGCLGDGSSINPWRAEMTALRETYNQE